MSGLHSCLWLDKTPGSGRTHLLIHSSVDGHLNCFCLLAITINAAVHIYACVFSCSSVFRCFAHAPECCCWVTQWFSWTYCSTAKPPQRCAVVGFHQHCMKAPIAPHAHQYFSSFKKILFILLLPSSWVWGGLSSWLWFRFPWQLVIRASFCVLAYYFISPTECALFWCLKLSLHWTLSLFLHHKLPCL